MAPILLIFDLILYISSLILNFCSELWLVPAKRGTRVPTTFRNPKKEVVRAFNFATRSSHQGEELRIFEDDLGSVEIEGNVLRVRFVAEGRDTPLGRILHWSNLGRPVRISVDCRVQAAVLPRHEEILKVS